MSKECNKKKYEGKKYNKGDLENIPNDQYSCPECKSVPNIKEIDYISGNIRLECPNSHGKKYINIDEYFKNELKYIYYNSKCAFGGLNQWEVEIKSYGAFSHCFKENKTLCFDCARADSHKEFLVKVNELNNKCSKHLKNYNRYCLACKNHFCDDIACKCNHDKDKILQIPKAENKDIEKIKKRKEQLVQKKNPQEKLIKLLDTLIETYQKHPTNYYHSINIRNVANNINEEEGDVSSENVKILNKINQLEEKISEFLTVKLKVDFKNKKLNLNGKNLKDEDFKLISCLNLPNLEEIDLSHNQIKDPSPLANFNSPNLREVDLSFNLINGIQAIKDNIIAPGKFKHLIEFKLDNNKDILQKDIEEIRSLLKVEYYKECELEYELEKNNNQIRIFGENFVKNNKDNCKIKINNNTDKEDIIDIYKYNEYKEKNKKLTITLYMKNNVEDLSGLFNGCKALKKINRIFDINSNSSIYDISDLFQECKYLETLPDSISEWDTSKIVNMSGLFYGCERLESLPNISKWNTGNVTNMMSMFNGCKSLKSIPDISSWDISKTENISCMFINCSSLRQIPEGISNWNTSKCQKFKYIFKGCIKVTQFPNTQNWNKKSVTDQSEINKMFN